MLKRIIVMLAALLPFGPVLAENCGEYPLTQAQVDALQDAQLDIEVPSGEIPFVQRCDVDENSIIDWKDLWKIRKHRGQLASSPDDPKDWDGDGKIRKRDLRGCASSCTFRHCFSRDWSWPLNNWAKHESPDHNQTNQLPGGMQESTAEAEPQNTVGQPGNCFEAADFDGDGSQDFMGIFEYVGTASRGNNWDLQMVILYQDAAGNEQVVAYPYTGQTSGDGQAIFQHLGMQNPGVVDLMPGSITIPNPGVVSFRNNVPETLYYFLNGELKRAFYGVDD